MTADGSVAGFTSLVMAYVMTPSVLSCRSVTVNIMLGGAHFRLIGKTIAKRASVVSAFLVPLGLLLLFRRQRVFYVVIAMVGCRLSLRNLKDGNYTK